jgi:class 3 adenylate cyclase
LTQYIGEARRGTALIKPDEAHPFAFVAEPGALYRLMSIENHVACFLQTTDRRSTGAQALDIDILPTGFSPTRVDIAAGSILLNVRNRLKTDTGVILALTDFPRLRHIMQHHPSKMVPFFTGKMLLNNQSFRDLFRVQHLVPGLKLPIRSLTVLFTDLKGSTELYDRTGDAFAYGLVQEHYRLLSDSVREYAGAVVKTMGDAIMATFSDPHSAVRSAVSMIQRLEAMRARWQTGDDQLGLKIGLHAGPALAVNADDRLDYFGQTVNIAARVQNLAQAGEIWCTEPVFHATGVQETLVASGYREEKHLVALKGVGQPTTVYQCLALSKEGRNFAREVPTVPPVAASAAADR